MKHKSILLIKSANHYLLQALEVLNLLDEDDYKLLIHKSRIKHKHIKQICENAERGSMWLTIFFVLEMLDEIEDEN